MENMEQEKRMRRYKLLSRICLGIGFVGLFDVLLASVSNSQFAHLGFVAMVTFFLLGSIVGIGTAAWISSILAVLLKSSSVVFLALGYFYNQKAKVIATPTASSKGLKLSKIILWVLAGIVGFSFLAGFVFGGMYANPDRKTQGAVSDLNQVMTSIAFTTQQITLALSNNKLCFEDNSLKNGDSAQCVTNLENIQTLFKSANSENLSEIQQFYTNGANLDSNDKQMALDYLLLYNSAPYSDATNAGDQYLTAYIAWHKFFRDVVDVKGVDQMSSAELMQTKTLAQNIVDATQNLQVKTNALSDYIHQNFDQNFINSMTQTTPASIQYRFGL